MVYCYLANGFEEIEALAPVDLLRRAGVEVKTVGVGGTVVTGSHGIPVTADLTEAQALLTNALDAVILPGGMPGTLHLEASASVQAALDFANANGRLICAICAAPSVLGHKGLLKGREAICFPGFEKDLIGATVSKKAVVKDGNFITAKGAGVAVDFGLAIVAALRDPATANKIRAAIQCQS